MARKSNGAANRASLSERAREWDSAHREALQHGATRCDDKYLWLRLVAASPLPSTTKLVAHTLALHGRKNGASIHPSTRTIAEESSLSERAVCTHLELLVRSGRLWRSQVNAGRKWALTVYTLCAQKPEVANAAHTAQPWQTDPTWRPGPDVRGTEPASAPSQQQGTERRSARQTGQTLRGTERGANGTERHADGTEPDADGTERGAGEALKDVLSSSSSGVSHLSSSHSSSSERALPRTARAENGEQERSARKKAAQTERLLLDHVERVFVECSLAGTDPPTMEQLAERTKRTREEVETALTCLLNSGRLPIKPRGASRKTELVV